MLKRDSTIVRANDKIVGRVVGNRFVKKVKGSRHQLHSPRAWAIDCQSLADAESLGADAVEIHDTENGIVYAAPISRIVGRGFKLDRGHGRQICLPLKLWDARQPGAPQQLALALM